MNNNIFRAIFLILIFTFMAVLNWGDLTKSQVDSETIEEAIARIIEEHNEDEESHLAAGQSLEAHKSADVIDHPPGSVVADKQSYIEIKYESNFDSIDSFATGGDVSSEFNAALLYIEQGGTLESYLFGASAISTGINLSAIEWLFQEVGLLDKTTEKFELALGVTGNSYTPASVEQSGAYFHLDGTTLYAKIKPPSGDTVSESLGTFDLTSPHIFRIHNNLESGFVEFYVDGVLESSLEWPSATWTIGVGTHCHLKADGDIESLKEVSAYISSLFLSYQI